MSSDSIIAIVSGPDTNSEPTILQLLSDDPAGRDIVQGVFLPGVHKVARGILRALSKSWRELVVSSRLHVSIKEHHLIGYVCEQLEELPAALVNPWNTRNKFLPRNIHNHASALASYFEHGTRLGYNTNYRAARIRQQFGLIPCYCFEWGGQKYQSSWRHTLKKHPEIFARDADEYKEIPPRILAGEFWQAMDILVWPSVNGDVIQNDADLETIQDLAWAMRTSGIDCYEYACGYLGDALAGYLLQYGLDAADNDRYPYDVLLNISIVLRSALFQVIARRAGHQSAEFFRKSLKKYAGLVPSEIHWRNAKMLIEVEPGDSRKIIELLLESSADLSGIIEEIISAHKPSLYDLSQATGIPDDMYMDLLDRYYIRPGESCLVFSLRPSCLSQIIRAGIQIHAEGHPTKSVRKSIVDEALKCYARGEISHELMMNIVFSPD